MKLLCYVQVYIQLVIGYTANIEYFLALIITIVIMSEPELQFAVLLKSTQGYIEIKDKSHLKHVLVHKGSLLICLDSLTVNKAEEKHERPVNYKVLDRHDNPQSGAFLLVKGASVLHNITITQREFLLGIKQTHYRMEVLERLEWMESLKVGSEVYFTIATIPTPVKGIVRYIGELPGEEGTKFGIEMMVCMFTYIV